MWYESNAIDVHCGRGGVNGMFCHRFNCRVCRCVCRRSKILSSQLKRLNWGSLITYPDGGFRRRAFSEGTRFLVDGWSHTANWTHNGDGEGGERRRGGRWGGWTEDCSVSLGNSLPFMLLEPLCGEHPVRLEVSDCALFWTLLLSPFPTSLLLSLPMHIQAQVSCCTPLRSWCNTRVVQLDCASKQAFHWLSPPNNSTV